MKFEDAAEKIKEDWRRILPQILQPARTPVNGETSYICPLCGHGTHGDGLTFNPHSTAHGLICYGCTFSGSVISLYMEMQNVDYIEAVNVLADLDGVIIDENDRTERPQTTSKRAEAETVQKRTEEPTEPQREPQAGLYRDKMIKLSEKAGPAADYMKDRGFKESFINQLIDAHMIAYSPAHKFHSKETGESVTADGIMFSYNAEFSYCSFRSFNGKMFDKPPEKEAGKEPLFYAAELYSGAPCFVCESQLDALSIIQAGGHAVATGGTAYSKLITQCQERRPAAPLILMFDNDPEDDKGHRAGPEAQGKCAAELTAAGIPYMIAQIDFNAYNGPHKDANDLLRADAGKLAADIAANVKEASKSEIERFLDETYTQKYKGVPTGVKTLDEALNGGFIPQTLILLSAEPGAGKTALATQIWENMAREGHPCIYLNLEMSKQQMLARSISRRVYVETNHTLKVSALNVLRGYEMTEADRDRVRGIALEFERTTLKNLQYNPANVSNSLDDILQYIDAEAQKATAAGLPAPYICVDYLHIMTGAPGEDPAEMLKRAVFKFKEYAERYNSIVLAIMAQGRQVNKSNTATMSAGRDTGGLEYAADLQAQLLTNEEGLKKDEIALHITKSRFTQTKMKEGLKFGMYGAYSYLEERGPFTPGELDFDDTIEDDTEPVTKGHRGRRRKSSKKTEPAGAEPQDAYWENSDFIDFEWPDDPD